MKKARVIMCAICTMIAIIIMNISTLTTSASEAECNTSMEYANNGIFMIGTAEDEVISKDFSISDYVNYYKKNRIGIPVCAYYHGDLEASELNVIELKSKLDYPCVQISANDDLFAEKANISIEYWDRGGIVYDIYTFDYSSEDLEANSQVFTFYYFGFRYTIFTKNGKFYVSKMWLPQENSRVYETVWENESQFQTLKQKLKQAFNEGNNIVFIQNDECIHAFVTNNGKEEYIFRGWNEKPIDENCEIIASVKSQGDEYTIYRVGNFICLDSAKRSGILDHPNAKVG